MGVTYGLGTTLSVLTYYSNLRILMTPTDDDVLSPFYR